MIQKVKENIVYIKTKIKQYFKNIIKDIMSSDQNRTTVKDLGMPYKGMLDLLSGYYKEERNAEDTRFLYSWTYQEIVEMFEAVMNINYICDIYYSDLTIKEGKEIHLEQDASSIEELMDRLEESRRSK